MAAVWHQASASANQPGGVTAVLVLVHQECGAPIVTGPAVVATTVPVTPRVEPASVLRACSPLSASSPANQVATDLPANSAASAMGCPVTPRLEPASVPKEEIGPGLMTLSAPRLILATMEVSSRSPAAAHLAGWAQSAPCPARKASTDLTAPWNATAITVASATASQGSATA